MSNILAFRSVFATKLLTSDILFSIAVNAELVAAILGILFPISVIFAFKSVFS